MGTNENLSRLFECPACLGYMKENIFICLAGHSICEDCWKALQICPTCRAALSCTRNYNLESVASMMKFPCENTEFGCEEQCYLRSMTEHLDICSFRMYPCKLGRGCKWSGRKKELEKHALDAHRKNVLVGVENIIFWKNALPKNEITMILAHKEIFYFHKKTQQDTVYYVMQYVGKSEDSIQYYFQIDVNSDQFQHRSMSIQENCCDDLCDITEKIDAGEVVGISAIKLETLACSNGFTKIKLSTFKA